MKMEKAMRKITVLLGLVALLSLPAFAGEGCEAGTQACLDEMANYMAKKGLIGVDGEWTDDGLVIGSFIDGTNAQAAGVRLGDVLIAINGISLSDKDAMKADSENRNPGSVAKITVLRNGEKKKMKVTLMGLSQEQIAKYVGKHLIEDHVKMAKADN